MGNARSSGPGWMECTVYRFFVSWIAAAVPGETRSKPPQMPKSKPGAQSAGLGCRTTAARPLCCRSQTLMLHVQLATHVPRRSESPATAAGGVVRTKRRRPRASDGGGRGASSLRPFFRLSRAQRPPARAVQGACGSESCQMLVDRSLRWAPRTAGQAAVLGGEAGASREPWNQRAQ